MDQVLILIAAVVGVCTLAGFLARRSWVCELTTHFRVQYAVILLGSSAGLLLLRQPMASAVAGVGALVNLSTFVPLCIKKRATSAPPHSRSACTTLRAMLINVNHRNRAYEETLQLIQTVQPDLVVVIEVTHPWKAQLLSLRGAYPFIEGMARHSGWGMLVMSRFPFERSQVLDRRESGIPAVVAEVSVSGQRMTLITAHPHAPMSRHYAASRNAQLVSLAQLVVAQRPPLMVLGDLNISPWSPYFHDLLRRADLRDTRAGHGLQPTWPAGWPWLGISIDHCLVSTGVVVHRWRIGPDIGSDHYPVIVEFSLEA